jgi:hypothetical protein
MLGTAVGEYDGCVDEVGRAVGNTDGKPEGETLGDVVGDSVGAEDMLGLKVTLGPKVGELVVPSSAPKTVYSFSSSS